MADAARPLVIVTRPREDSEALAKRLNSLGYDALVEPMLEIAPTKAEIPLLENYAALIFTSANGVRAFAGRQTMRSQPSYAVGSTTAAALQDAGFEDIRTGSGDAQLLADLIAKDQPTGARLLHVSGAAVARDLAALLEPKGICVDRAALYEALPAKQFSQPLVAALYACTVSFVLFFSARTAETFGTVAAQMALTERCCSTAAICLSQAVARKAASLPWTRVLVAAEPTEEALLMLLLPIAGRTNG